MKKTIKFKIGLTVLGLLFIAGSAYALTPMEQLGKNLYFDENLSEPAGQACASCHHPFASFVDPDGAVPVSEGVNPGLFGNRNSPLSAYAAYSPVPFWNAEGLYIGGQFWDGRALDLADQAKQPFLNPVEMANPDRKTVIRKIQKSSYAGLFAKVCKSTLKDIDAAYDCMANAIAAFEMTAELNRFSSKFDCFVAAAGDAGQVNLNNWNNYTGNGLTGEELYGLALFNDVPANGGANCAACHPSSAPADGSAPGAVFTDFSYDNLGVPANPELLALPGNAGFVDLGLGQHLRTTGFDFCASNPDVCKPANEDGKVKVMSLRNIAMTAPYMHNGVFTTLHQVVDFYNTAGVDPKWGPPEVAANVNRGELGDLGLLPGDVDAIVAFLNTLTDGYICQ